MNHACQPNIAVLHIDVPGSHAHVPPNLPPYTGTPVPSRLTLLAKRPIYPGEELTVSYVSPLLGVTERRRELRQWGIEHCQCSRCMQEEKEPKSEGLPELDEARKRELDDLEAELRQSFGFGL
jgi:SET domain